MKRNEIVGKLLKEGFSEKTLVRFSDKQLNELANRMLGETITTTMDSIQKSPALQAAAKDKTQTLNVVGEEDVEEELKGNQDKIDADKDGEITGNDFKILNKQKNVKEELKGNQKKIDKNHNGKIDAQDFKILKGQKKKHDVTEMLRFFDDDGETIKDEKGKETAVSTKDKDYEKKVKGKDKEEPKKKEEVNEVDMGLTIKGSKSSGSDVFGGKSKSSTPSAPKKKTNPFEKKEKKETEENDDTDESIDSILHKAIAEKLEKVLDREPTEEEIDEVLEKYMEQYQEHNESDESEEEENESEKPSEGLSKEKKGEDISKKEKSDKYSEEEIEKDKKRWPKNAFKPGKQPSPNFNGYKKKEDVKETKNWVNNLVENEKFHSFTSKNEIMELIKTKLTESDTMTQVGPKVKKGHNGVPEFMTYDAITTAAEPTTKPKPTTKPGTKPGEKPKTPYQPGPGTNPKPKAMYEEKKSK